MLVNMNPSAEKSPAKTRYHHGDLRRALMASAELLIESRGHARLSLREIAEAAGVSVAAPYRHFADRDALIAAVLADGFRELTRRTDAARRAAPDAMTALGSVGMAYVQFAAEHPGIYRLMFGAESNEAAHPELMAAGHEAYTVLADAVAACKEAGLIGDADMKTVALASWSLSHGLASLHAEGMLSPLPGGLEPTARALIRTLIDGVRPRVAEKPGRAPDSRTRRKMPPIQP